MRWTTWDHPAEQVCTSPGNRQFRCAADDARLVPINGPAHLQHNVEPDLFDHLSGIVRANCLGRPLIRQFKLGRLTQQAREVRPQGEIGAGFRSLAGPSHRIYEHLYASGRPAKHDR
jgi:hypothetical protein